MKCEYLTKLKLVDKVFCRNYQSLLNYISHKTFSVKSKKSIFDCAKDNDLDEIIFHLENGLEEDKINHLVQIAIENHHLEIIVYLLANGATTDLRIIFQHNRYTLHFCSFNGHRQVVSDLLKVNEFQEFLNSEQGSTALHFAAWNGHLEIVTHFIELGINANPWTRQAFSDLHWLAACENGDFNLVNRIISSISEFNIEVIDNMDKTALRLAVENDHLEVFKAQRCQI